MTSSFRETSWTLVEQSRGKDEAARLALSELCTRCYAPVHKFIALWCRDQEAARDLTHSFFARVLEGGSLDGAERERGRFRSYLLGAVKHFVCETRLHEQRQKRGLQHEHVPLKDEPLNDEHTLPPDAEFDRAWALALLDRSLATLQQEMEASGKGPVFEALKPWLAGTALQGQQLLAAKALGISETAVRVLVHRLRKRFREIIEREVAQTLDPGANVADELRHLLAVL